MNDRGTITTYEYFSAGQEEVKAPDGALVALSSTYAVYVKEDVFNARFGGGKLVWMGTSWYGVQNEDVHFTGESSILYSHNVMVPLKWTDVFVANQINK